MSARGVGDLRRRWIRLAIKLSLAAADYERAAALFALLKATPPVAPERPGI